MGDEWKEIDFDWIRSIYKFREMGHSINYFFQLDIAYNLHNNTERTIYVSNSNQLEYLNQAFITFL